MFKTLQSSKLKIHWCTGTKSISLALLTWLLVTVKDCLFYSLIWTLNCNTIYSFCKLYNINTKQKLWILKNKTYLLSFICDLSSLVSSCNKSLMSCVGSDHCLLTTACWPLPADHLMTTGWQLPADHLVDHWLTTGRQLPADHLLDH